MRGIGVYEEAQEQRRLWTPTAMSLKVWWDVSSLKLTTVSGNISQIDDLSGNGNHATQTTSARRPSFLASWRGMPWANFNAASSHNMDYASGIEPNFIAAVGVLAGTGVSRNIAGAISSDSGTFDAFWFGTNSSSQFRFLRPTTVADPTNDMVSTVTTPLVNVSLTPYLLVGSHDGSVIRAWVNGWAGASDTASTGLRQLGNGVLGAVYNSDAKTNYWFGYIGEVIIASNQSDPIRRMIEGYLAWKWNFQQFLIGTHPYRNQPPLI